MRTRLMPHTERTCLTCKYWVRHSDKMMGSCQATGLPLGHSYRAQHEDCTEGCYQWGEDRPAAKYEYVKGWGQKVCAYYDLTMDVTR